MLANPQTYFAELPDPKRQTRNKLHKLEDIVMITLCAVLCGFEDWVSIEDFGCEQEQWLRGFLELPHGIASHDTLSDVMGRIDRQAFASAFGQWMQQSLAALAGQQVALDGKSLRGSRDGHPTLHEDVASWLDYCDARGEVYQVESIEKDHGRLETRRVVVSTELDWLEIKPEWVGLKAVAMVESTREPAGKARLQASVQRRYYLCSMKEPVRIGQAIREHWRIENQQHWAPA
jgi:predicted transposase YbfD/YdcC